MQRTIPRAALAAAAVATGVGTVVGTGCGFIENDRSLAAPITTTTEPGRTTLPPGPKTPISSADVCTLLDQDALTAAGIDASLGQPEDVSGIYTLQTPGDEAACRWYLGAQGTIVGFTVAVATGVGSEAFEAALAAPGIGDPFTVDGLGDMAATVTERGGLRSNDGTDYVLVLAGGKLLKIESLNALLTPVETLVELARLLLPKLA